MALAAKEAIGKYEDAARNSVQATTNRAPVLDWGHSLSNPAAASREIWGFSFLSLFFLFLFLFKIKLVYYKFSIEKKINKH